MKKQIIKLIINNQKKIEKNKQIKFLYKITQKVEEKHKMRQFESQIYKGIPPFGTSLFHRQIQPKQQSFLEMARFTFFPYFAMYSFSFFWIILISFVFIYSQSYRIPTNYVQIDSDNQFLKVSQAALFQLGQNYPYHIVFSFHYYRVLTSMVLFRNFHHFVLTCIGILTLGSYIQNVIGFKRCFLLAIITGVIGILANNIFNKNATLEPTTPVFGIIGFSIGYFLQKCNSEWKYYANEKFHMIIMLIILGLLYGQLILMYSNVNLLSNFVALGFGFLYCFGIPGENQAFTIRNIFAILVMAGLLTAIIIAFFFHTKAQIIQF